jgi:hypothetical protein
MSTQIQYRRGTGPQSDAFTGVLGEITVDTTNKTIRVHDGLTVGGAALAKQSNVDASFAQANLAFDKANASTDAASITSGTLAIARGGTNGTSFTTGNLIVFDGTGLKSIANSGVTAGIYGGASNTALITIDEYGRVTAASNVAGGGGTDFAFYMGAIALI